MARLRGITSPRPRKAPRQAACSVLRRTRLDAAPPSSLARRVAHRLVENTWGVTVLV